MDKYLDKILNNVGSNENIDPVEVFKHLIKLNLFEGNIKSLRDLEDTVVGKLINKTLNSIIQNQ